MAAEIPTKVHVFQNAEAKSNKDNVFYRLSNRITKFSTRTYVVGKWLHKKLDRFSELYHRYGEVISKTAIKRARYRLILENNVEIHTVHSVDDTIRIISEIKKRDEHSIVVFDGGDGTIKEGITSDVNYTDRYNAILPKVVAAINDMIGREKSAGDLEKAANDLFLRISGTGSELEQRIGSENGQHRQGEQDVQVSHAARLVVDLFESEKKEIPWESLKDMELDEKEKKFIALYGLLPVDFIKTSLKKPRLDYFKYLIVKGGTFNVTAGSLKQPKNKDIIRYAAECIDEKKEINYTKLPPMRVEYERTDSHKKTLYGMMYAMQSAEGFFRFYTGGVFSALSIIFGALSGAEKYKDILTPKTLEYAVRSDAGEEHHFSRSSTLAACMAIKNLPFGFKFFDPAEGCFHFAVSDRDPRVLAAAAFDTIVGNKLPESYVSHSYTDVTWLRIRSSDIYGNLHFVLDGDTKDKEGAPYQTDRIEITAGPKINVVRPPADDSRRSFLYRGAAYMLGRALHKAVDMKIKHINPRLVRYFERS